MKKGIVLVLALCLAFSTVVNAENGNGLKGKMYVSGYGAYAIGMGDVFKEYTAGEYKFKSSAGIGFGGAFHYGVNPKMLIGGELGFQSYKYESSGPAPYPSVSDTETKMNILATAFYALNYVENQSALFLAFGAGQYGGFDKLGFNAGVMYSKMMAAGWILFVMPRLHYVMTDPDAAMMFQVLVGASFPLGSK